MRRSKAIEFFILAAVWVIGLAVLLALLALGLWWDKVRFIH